MNFQEIFNKARDAAEAAYIAAVPAPMKVVDHRNNIVEVVEDGLCGFAWVRFDGRDPMVKFLKNAGIGSKGYPKGYEVWSSEIMRNDVGQSHARKVAGCRAFASVLSENGIKSQVGHRLD